MIVYRRVDDGSRRRRRTEVGRDGGTGGHQPGDRDAKYENELTGPHGVSPVQLENHP